MSRARWAAWGLAASLGLASGCCPPLLQRPLFRPCCSAGACAPACECCGEGVPVPEGPALPECGVPGIEGAPGPVLPPALEGPPGTVLPPGASLPPGTALPPATLPPAATTIPGLAPQPTVPPLAPPPQRLVPQPATPEPYRP
jgi:hypothetical protein